MRKASTPEVEDEYFLTDSSGKKQGPFEIGQIRTMARSGQLAADSVLESEETGEIIAVASLLANLKIRGLKEQSLNFFDVASIVYLFIGGAVLGLYLVLTFFHGPISSIVGGEWSLWSLVTSIIVAGLVLHCFFAAVWVARRANASYSLAATPLLISSVAAAAAPSFFISGPVAAFIGAVVTFCGLVLAVRATSIALRK